MHPGGGAAASDCVSHPGCGFVKDCHYGHEPASTSGGITTTARICFDECGCFLGLRVVTRQRISQGLHRRPRIILPRITCRIRVAGSPRPTTTATTLPRRARLLSLISACRIRAAGSPRTTTSARLCHVERNWFLRLRFTAKWRAHQSLPRRPRLRPRRSRLHSQIACRI